MPFLVERAMLLYLDLNKLCVLLWAQMMLLVWQSTASKTATDIQTTVFNKAWIWLVCLGHWQPLIAGIKAEVYWFLNQTRTLDYSMDCADGVASQFAGASFLLQFETAYL